VDFLFAISIVNLYLNKNKTNGINRTLEFCGKHSFNIFLFHTFIFYLYFQSFIYWSKNPLLIFMTLIVVTLAISFAAEWLKERIGFYKLQNKIGNLLK
jgi:peptidoglycan/LPS O-acetylase OafA/YrhL